MIDLDEILERYRKESLSFLTVNELKQITQYFLPVVLNNKLAGIYGLTLHKSEKYGKVAEITLVYIFPECRGKMKEVAKQITQLMKLINVNYIEMQATPPMKRWIERCLKVTPVGFFFSLQPDYILKTLER
jgi:hypothetical protein